MKIEGLMREQLHPDKWERFIIQEGNLRHEYFGRERFAAAFEHEYGPGMKAHVVSVTTIGSDCDEYLLVNATKDAEDPDGDDARHSKGIHERFDRIEESLARIMEALEELLRRSPRR